MSKELINYAANESNIKWQNIIKREDILYKRNNDLRSEFERDYNRIIHSTAYRRLKHKTQVFFSPENDHICTRSEHVAHVESISYTIAKYLGLNTELTRAIATAHDLGHSPFGHQGEKILNKFSEEDIGEKFWHEKNGLEMVDKIEILETPNGEKTNMNLTYAVRDGIISHCGEIDENQLRPRDEIIDLAEYKYPNQFAPYTWEGVVVKISDKISYLGRDIADAVRLGILDEHLEELYKLLNYDSKKRINNTVIINELVYDLCQNSNPEKGLCFSDKMFKMINEIKKFNYQNIYLSDKLLKSTEYFELVLNNLYTTLKSTYKNKENANKICPELVTDFENWLKKYWNLKRENNLKNKVVFNMNNEKDYFRAIIYYISGMTDNYATEMYNKIIKF
ncbi:MAG: deoxyguanosinetriphosphate triphosphohydrolase family protein [Clostridia bacterium]